MIKTIGKSNAGMSLVEIMIVMTLLSIFSIFMVNLIMTSQNATTIQNISVPIRAEAKQIMEAMMRELRAADPAEGITIDGTGNSRITFSVPTVVSSQGVTDHDQIQFSYDQVQRQITRTDGTNTDILGRNVQSLVFSQANDVITATVGTRATTAAGTAIEATLTSQVKVRN
ncbi:MAG: prepilin-type N-terminal cleavage/methylation domain-containing protein [Candidatus Omnitrophica bacterium]|nr:prepilin-type N-terminal cleavage/methylation domain-containing protein [Candidatus Omnitrophota bacterium]